MHKIFGPNGWLHVELTAGLLAPGTALPLIPARQAPDLGGRDRRSPQWAGAGHPASASAAARAVWASAAEEPPAAVTSRRARR